MLNYFNQPHYSYVKKKIYFGRFLCLYCPLLEKKKCFSSLVCIVHQQLIRMALVPEKLAEEPHQSLKHKSCTYIGHHWLVPPCVFLTMVSCSDKCCDPTLCKGPVAQTRADGWRTRPHCAKRSWAFFMLPPPPGPWKSPIGIYTGMWGGVCLLGRDQN